MVVSNADLAGFGLIAQAGGAVTSAIGAFYGAQAAKAQARSAEIQAELESSLALINARAAEFEATQAVEDAQRRAASSGLQYRRIRASADAALVARGVASGVGSAGEIIASIDYAKDADRLSITRAGARAAAAARIQASNFRNRADAASTNAANARDAFLPNAALAGLTSLIGGAGQVAGTWAETNRRFTRGEG